MSRSRTRSRCSAGGETSTRAPRKATYTAWVGESDASFLPEQLRSTSMASARRLLPAMQALGPAVAHRVQQPSYLQLQRMEDSFEGHALRRYWKGHYFRELTDDAIQTILLRGTPDGRGEHLPAVALQAYGGAIADVPDSDTAFSHRDTQFEFIAAARWSNPAEDDVRIAAARGCATPLDRFASGAYVNTLGDEGSAGLRRAYPPDKLARLAALKAAYDPDNVFHLNQNITPSTTAERRDDRSGQRP